MTYNDDFASFVIQAILNMGRYERDYTKNFGVMKKRGIW